MLALLVAAAGVSAVSAGAAGGPELLIQFGSSGTDAGQLTNPRGVATDAGSGHVYIADLNNQRIDEFTAWGRFVKAWGFGVADGTTAALQSCGPQATPPTAQCFKGLAVSAAGGFKNPLGVAVDSTGDVYVVDFSNRRVQKFNSAGEFLLTFGGGVNKTKVDQRKAQEANLEPVTVTAQEENLCPIAPGDVCQAGTTGTGQGQFGAWKVGAFIAVGPGDLVYVGDANRVQKFNLDGTFNSQIDLPEAGFVQSLAVDPSGNLYVASEQSKNPGVRKLSPSGAVLATIGSALNGQGESVAVVPTGLATDVSGNLYVIDEQKLGFSPVVLKFSPGGEQRASFGEGDFTSATGIGTNPIGDVYVANSTPANSYVRAYGPLPTDYEPPPSVPPTIGAEYAASVGTASAVVEAEINPHFFPTTYYVQYGRADCESNPCAEQPAAPGSPLAGQRESLYRTGGVSLSGLTPGAAYHYRFVARSEAGTVFGPDRTFVTYRPEAFALPDGRAFEMVSPPEKNSAEVGAPGNTSGLSFGPKPLQASLSGDAIAYPSFTAFGDAQSAPGASRYLSGRGAEGWSTANITPPNAEGRTWDPFRGFSPDLSFAALVQKEPQLDPAAVKGFENLYVRDNRTGSLRALTTTTPRGPGAGLGFCIGFAGASANFEHVIFQANAALTSDAPEAAGFSLYEWSAGKLSLVSVLPDESPAAPSANLAFGAGGACDMDQSIVRNAISRDGSRIFWTTGEQLFARLDGAKTIQLDASQGGPDPSGGGKFWAASNDGSRVFFTSPNRLTPDASAPAPGSLGDLYMYDFDAPSGSRLKDLTVDPTPGSDPAAVKGVIGASDDGSYVYFVGEGVLDGNAIAGEPNLYVWHAGDVHFIRTLSPDDEEIGNSMEGWVRFSNAGGVDSSWSGVPAEQVGRVTPDGRHLAFVSLARLTGYDNVGQAGGEPASQVYLYSADSDKLVCASCNPSGARPLGYSDLPVWITPYEQPRYLSDDGGRLFFLSHDSLTLHDTNGRQDVYEFERQGLGSCTAESTAFNAASGGCVYLISPGSSGEHSFFLDASPDGGNVFLSARAQLVSTDRDERFDVYDARVNGGFPSPPSPPSPCVGEACRPIQAAPTTAAPGSSGFAGPGNARPRRPGACGRKHLRRGGRCISSRKLARRICRRKHGEAKRRCIRKQLRRLNGKAKGRQRRAPANRGAAR